MKGNKIDRRSLYSINLIKETFLDLLKEKPLDKITITEICETADINRGTFYKYFTDTYDVLGKLEDSFVTAAEEKIRATNIDFSDSRELINLFVEASQINATIPFNHVSKEFFEEYTFKMVDRLRPIAEAKIKEVVPQANSFVLTSYICTGVLATIILWYIQENELTREQLVDELYASVINTIEGYKK